MGTPFVHVCVFVTNVLCSRVAGVDVAIAPNSACCVAVHHASHCDRAFAAGDACVGSSLHSANLNEPEDHSRRGARARKPVRGSWMLVSVASGVHPDPVSNRSLCTVLTRGRVVGDSGPLTTCWASCTATTPRSTAAPQLVPSRILRAPARSIPLLRAPPVSPWTTRPSTFNQQTRCTMWSPRRNSELMRLFCCAHVAFFCVA